MLAGSEVGRYSSDPPYGIYAYTAREWDPEANLYYYRARYYDPKIGRFISEDPVKFGAGVNFYAYVLGNPIRYFDPSGLDVYVCQRPTRMRGMGRVPHGLMWSTNCQKSYSFGPSKPRAGAPAGGRVDPTDNPGIDPDGKAKPPYQCTLKSRSECYERCVCRLIDEDAKSPPAYGPNKMCWDAINDVDVICSIECQDSRG